MKTVGYKIWARYQPATRRPADSKHKPTTNQERWDGMVSTVTYTMSGIGYWHDKSLYIAQISKQNKPYIREIPLDSPTLEDGWYTDEVVDIRPLPDDEEKTEYLYIRFIEK